MRFKELGEILQIAEAGKRKCGFGIKTQAAYDKLYSFLDKKYSDYPKGKLGELFISDKQVPEDIMANFKPFYHLLRELYKQSTGKELKYSIE